MSRLARIGAKLRFHRPELFTPPVYRKKGHSAVDEVELTNHNVRVAARAYARLHPHPSATIMFTAARSSERRVPDFAEVHFYVRHPKSEIANKIYARLPQANLEAGRQGQ